MTVKTDQFILMMDYLTPKYQGQIIAALCTLIDKIHLRPHDINQKLHCRELLRDMHCQEKTAYMLTDDGYIGSFNDDNNGNI